MLAIMKVKNITSGNRVRNGDASNPPVTTINAVMARVAAKAISGEQKRTGPGKQPGAENHQERGQQRCPGDPLEPPQPIRKHEQPITAIQVGNPHRERNDHHHPGRIQLLQAIMFE